MSTYDILVIEDDEIVARTIERSLRNQEFKVTAAASGIEGLNMARNQPPDLVILDVIMPGMDGYAVCREMRADIKLSDVPVLFLTAKIKDEDKITGFKVGADDYLSKPFNIDELILRVRVISRRAGRSHPAGSRWRAGDNRQRRVDHSRQAGFRSDQEQYQILGAWSLYGCRRLCFRYRARTSYIHRSGAGCALRQCNMI